jgi:hypothetical protein
MDRHNKQHRLKEEVIMNEALTYSTDEDYTEYLTYQANLFDDCGDCYFDGMHIGTRTDYEIAYDL